MPPYCRHHLPISARLPPQSCDPRAPSSKLTELNCCDPRSLPRAWTRCRDHISIAATTSLLPPPHPYCRHSAATASLLPPLCRHRILIAASMPPPHLIAASLPPCRQAYCRHAAMPPGPLIAARLPPECNHAATLPPSHAYCRHCRHNCRQSVLEAIRTLSLPPPETLLAQKTVCVGW